MMSYDYPHPVSRTYRYRKITKPLLERKRRARINRCLEELKDLMVDALETEGENISKLEKADVLELTVRHLQRLQASRPSGLSAQASPGDESAESRWQSGFGHCAAEACRFLSALPGEAAGRLARHLALDLKSTRRVNAKQKWSDKSCLNKRKKKIGRKIPYPIRSINYNIKVMPKPTLTSSEVLMDSTVSSSLNLPIEASRSPDFGRISSPMGPSNLLEDVEKPSSLLLPRSKGPGEEETSEGDDCSLADDAVDLGDKVKEDATSSQVIMEEEEEIDVERVDETDPMWRPW
ncbi:enhancer of split mgamma protein-like [Orussus abietinus]|uniref:enhancer of split mgamma protein-like n=1 Tax=Orussus abietinus TaxID=222816 RepID=UPI000626BCD7|nr:enhancer of split mgamma protein-like [Orussus abietinus]